MDFDDIDPRDWVGGEASGGGPLGAARTAFRERLRRGETSLRRVLRPWPWAMRRRIYAHLRRRMAVESAAKTTSAGQTAGGLRRSPINYARVPRISDLFVP